jgi:hypothetical protein
MSGVSPFHDPEVPEAMLNRWFQAEDRLYPVVMVSPERYESAVRVVGRLAEHLRVACPDIPSLVAADGKGVDLVGRLAAEDPAAEGDVDRGLIAGAGFSIRYRELAANRSR